MITKDELFLIKLYELSKEEEVDRYEVGRKMGQNDRSVDNIVKLLAQTNFIKKGDGDSIYLTDLGRQLVEDLLNSKK